MFIVWGGLWWRMFRIFFGWAICVQACVHADGSQYRKQTKLNHLETDKVELMDKMEELDVVELEQPLKPVLHGTIVRITSNDKLCNLRMSTKKYPVK